MILSDYLDYTAGTEVPDMFNVWGGYFLVSTCVSRRVWFRLGNLTIFPNIYVMLVGDAGNGKTVAIKSIKTVLHGAEFTAISNSVETPEGLLRHMNGQPDKDPPIPSPVAFETLWPDGMVAPVYPTAVIANEFVNFINKAQDNWIAFLNDVYDEDNYTYRTKTMGKDNLIGPYITLFGALTTEVSFDLQNAKIISSGFARRTIFQYGARNFEVPHAIPETNPENIAILKSIIKQVQALSRCKGEFRWSNDAKATYKEWYDLDMPKNPGDASTPSLVDHVQTDPTHKTQYAHRTRRESRPRHGKIPRRPRIRIPRSHGKGPLQDLWRSRPQRAGRSHRQNPRYPRKAPRSSRREHPPEPPLERLSPAARF